MTNFPYGVASQGVPVIPGVPFTTGTYFFVDSATGNASYAGTDKRYPLPTLAAAIAKCTANKGDVIVCLPGHAETVTATSINLSVSGVTVFCAGNGAARATFTYGAAAATITVSAANVAFLNGRHIANFLNVASAFTTSSTDTVISGNDFIDNSSSLNFLCLVTTGTTNNASDGLNFSTNYVFGLAATDGACVSVLGNLNRLTVNYNNVDKNAVTSDAGHLITMSSKVCQGVKIIGNTVSMVALVSQATGALFTGSSTTSSGMCADNYLVCSDTSTAILATTGTKISFSQNFMSGAVDKSGTLIPTADDPT